MPRFVVLEHDHPYLHWDFMLEWGAVLRTWRLAEPPRPGPIIAAMPLGDHRRLYLDYQGPLSGERGQVVRWDHGTFTWQNDAADQITVVLQGERVRGTAVLGRGDAKQWRFQLID